MTLHTPSFFTKNCNKMAPIESIVCRRRTALRIAVACRQARTLHGTSRSGAEAGTASTEKLIPFDTVPVTTPPGTPARPLKNMSTSSLLRSIMLSEVFARPWIANIGMRVLKRLTTTKNPFLDPDRNWVLNRILRMTLYDHFCGGWQRDQIQGCLNKVKSIGYAGVILQYAREIVAHDLTDSTSAVDISAQQIKKWHEGNMQTLSMLGTGDYMAIKYTGAGAKVAEALRTGTNPPEQMTQALDELCSAAKAKETRILVDAEEQVYQPTIDRWAVDLMRQYNRDGNSCILNTYQAYLKSTPHVVREHLRLAGQEGWIMGIKLVRGAYILIETRSRIHDTKADTDACYDSIVRNVLTRAFDDVHGAQFPEVRLLAAGHNATSIRKATQLRREMLQQGVNSGSLEFGQLYGMADHVSGELLAQSEAAKRTEGLSAEEKKLQEDAAPRVLKCVNWGSVKECLGFLTRRAAENQGSTDRLLDGLSAAKQELWARMMRRS